jgi:microcystin-dependent protein
MSAQRIQLTPPPEPAPIERRGFLLKAAAALAGLAFLGQGRKSEAATLSSQPYIGEIMLFAGNFAPVGWALCNGQLLAISTNTALFSILGTTYGGNGMQTFGLPDLRGRAPVSFGQGAGLSNYTLGQVAGEEYHVLAPGEMPAHSHTAYADSANGTSENPASLLPARNPAGIPTFGATPATTLAATHIAPAGSSQPHNNLPPYLVINYCIALQGVFPPRA